MRRRILGNRRGGTDAFPITDNLFAYFEHNTESGNILDSWGDLIGENFGVTRGVAGIKDKAFSFTPANLTYYIIRETHNPSGKFRTAGNVSGGQGRFTINYWVKLHAHTPTLSSQTDQGFLVNDFNTAGHYPFTDGNIYLNLLTPVRKTIGAGIVADRTQWHMCTVTADEIGDVWKFYQNGQLVHTSTVGGSITFRASFEIGRNPSYYFNGLLDQVSYYSKALSQEEITALYNYYT